MPCLADLEYESHPMATEVLLVLLSGCVKSTSSDIIRMFFKCQLVVGEGQSGVQIPLLFASSITVSSERMNKE